MRILTFSIDPIYMAFHKALSDSGIFVWTADLMQISRNEHYYYISKIIDEAKPDLILTIGRHELHVDFNVLAEICRKKGIFHVYWATEDRTYHQKYSLKTAGKCDYVFTIAEECIPNYRILGKPSSLLRYGCDPGMHKKMLPVDSFRTDITIAASYHSLIDSDFVRNNVLGQENDGEIDFRKHCIEQIIHPLVERNYNLTIWGVGWDTLVPKEFIRNYLPYYSVPQLYNSSKIVLGLEWDNISETKTTGRPFEVLGCRALYLTYRTKAMSNLFKDRIHLLMTGSAGETLKLVDFYLKDDIGRENIAKEGQIEVYSKHTYNHRAIEFLNALYPYIRI